MFNLAKITSKYRSRLIFQVYDEWVKRGEKVLDVGCGNGVVSVELKNEFKIKVTGCDVIDYLTKNLPFTKMETDSKLPFPNKRFDVAMFNDVLHHTRKSNQKKLIEEALRVANKVLIFEVEPTFAGTISDYLLNMIHNKNMNIPFAFRTIGQWKKLFKKLNVKCQVKRVDRPLFYPFCHVAFYLKN